MERQGERNKGREIREQVVRAKRESLGVRAKRERSSNREKRKQMKNIEKA